MENTGKQRVIRIASELVFAVMFILLFETISAREITPEVITTTFPEADPGILDKIDRFYEVSERSLKIGYAANLETDSAFRTTIEQKDRYIVVSDFSNGSVDLVFLGSGKTLFNRQLNSGDYVIFKIGYLNLQFTLHSANKSLAQVELKIFEEEIPEDVDYFELFDIQVRLVGHTIYSPQDLSAIIEFTNFGDGLSHARLIYSVIDLDGREYYTGVDEKIVETTETMIKNFDTLDIPNGKYIVRATIYYGDNQEATSEESFELTDLPKTQLLRQPLIFIVMVLLAFASIIFFKKKNKTSKELL